MLAHLNVCGHGTIITSFRIVFAGAVELLPWASTIPILFQHRVFTEKAYGNFVTIEIPIEYLQSQGIGLYKI